MTLIRWRGMISAPLVAVGDYTPALVACGRHSLTVTAETETTSTVNDAASETASVAGEGSASVSGVRVFRDA